MGTRLVSGKVAAALKLSYQRAVTPPTSVLAFPKTKRNRAAYHARAGKGVPAKTNAILLLDVRPLLFQSFVIHSCETSICYVGCEFGSRGTADIALLGVHPLEGSKEQPIVVVRCYPIFGIIRLKQSGKTGSLGETSASL